MNLSSIVSYAGTLERDLEVVTVEQGSIREGINGLKDDLERKMDNLERNVGDLYRKIDDLAINLNQQMDSLMRFVR
jgi:uncharacterized protein YoxC